MSKLSFSSRSLSQLSPRRAQGARSRGEVYPTVQSGGVPGGYIGPTHPARVYRDPPTLPGTVKAVLTLPGYGTTPHPARLRYYTLPCPASVLYLTLPGISALPHPARLWDSSCPSLGHLSVIVGTPFRHRWDTFSTVLSEVEDQACLGRVMRHA